MSRGHRKAELLQDYTLAQLRLFAQAARQNRREEVWWEAVAVSIGIRDAFSQEGNLLKFWLALADSGGSSAAAPVATPRAAQLLAGMPVKGRG